MHKSKPLFLAFFVFLSCVFLAGVQGANVSVEWELTIDSPRGQMTSQAKFVQEGEKIAVTMTGPRGGESSGEGTIKGNTIQWSITRPGPGGNQFTISYKGTVEGTHTAGTADAP